MLIETLRDIGEALYRKRKLKGLTQVDVAERAGLSDRTYADIERGSANMRVETLLKICAALNVTPDEILTREERTPVTETELLDVIGNCSGSEKQTALKLLGVFVDFLGKNR